MNGEVNHTMEDVILSPLANLENSQEILEKPLVNLVEPEAFSEVTTVNPEKEEKTVQIPVSKSVEFEPIIQNTFLKADNPKEISNIYVENLQGLDKDGMSSSYTNLEDHKQIIDTSLVGLENTTKTIPVDLDTPKKNVKMISLEGLGEPKEMKEIYIDDSEEIEKIPFSDSDITKEIIKTPLVVSEKSDEAREGVFTDSEEPEVTLKTPFENTEDPKDIIEISPADSEESVKNIEIPHVNSDDSKQSSDLENVENEDHVIQIQTTKSINDTYNDLGEDAVSNGNMELSENNNSTDSDGVQPKVTTIQIFDLPDAEFTGNDVESPHCSNSNGSFAESIVHSQVKSETTSQQSTDRLNENSNNYRKTENDSRHSDGEVELDEITDVSEEEVKATDKVSIHSDTEAKSDLMIPVNEESSLVNQSEVTTNEIIIVDGGEIKVMNGNSKEASSPEIQEIDSENEDCKEIKEVKPLIPEDPVPLRRSSRAIKRKRYTDDLENVEDYEAGIEDPLRHKGKPMGVNNTKFRMEMSAKNMRYNQANRQNATIIIETSPARQTPVKGTGYSMHSNQNTHYMYMPRNANTFSNRINTVSNNSSQTPSILPSLTDDMYVVEAPSFIVPYVYEKPSMMAFKEFVENFGKELEAKEIELLEKHKDTEHNENNDKETTHGKSEESGDEDKSCLRKKNVVIKDKRRLKNDDDVSWDGESTTESEEDIISDKEEKSSIMGGYSLDQINMFKSNVPATKVASNKSDSYFDCSLGKFFTGIGYNLVQEYVQNDLLKQEDRKLYRAKKLGHNVTSTETSILLLKKNLELSKENNAPYALQFKKCQFCNFKTESDLILAHHLETPHFKNNAYKCNFCSFEVKSPHEILNHMDVVHSISGKLERSPACHQCANCTFEDNSKGKLARHLIPCMKKFKPEVNLSPPFDWEPPAKIPKISKARNSMVPSYQNTFIRTQITNNVIRPINASNMTPGNSSQYRARGLSMSVPPRPVPVHGLPIIRNTVMLRHNAPIANSSNFTVKQKSMHQPSISITPLPRQPQPIQSQQTNPKNSFVICEICDGYIKDLEQLRNHMQSIHKVKIHPKMIYNRPPLNCQKCQFRFFTDQGLERHLLGLHGLVTSSMQEAANRGKDAGRCPVCGRVYQWKLLNHVARDHNLSLKPAHLSYKCTVCAATFGMYNQFENHVYSAHSIVAKRVIDKSKIPPTQNKLHGNNASVFKPLKINDEITIIAQTMKTSKDK